MGVSCLTPHPTIAAAPSKVSVNITLIYDKLTGLFDSFRGIFPLTPDTDIIIQTWALSLGRLAIGSSEWAGSVLPDLSLI